MKSWIVIINHNENTLELKIEGESYSHARLSAERIYSGCIIIDISEVLSL